MKARLIPLLGLIAVMALSPAAGGAQLSCTVPEGGDERPSPFAQLTGSVGVVDVLVCYSRPSARGRTMVGGSDALHRFGEPWRLGANEATSIHVSAPAMIAGVAVEAGSYSVYAVPGQTQWAIHLNGLSERWGIPINAGVMQADVGVGSVSATSTDVHVETMTLSLQPTGPDSADLVLEWERYRVTIPIRSR